MRRITPTTSAARIAGVLAATALVVASLAGGCKRDEAGGPPGPEKAPAKAVPPADPVARDLPSPSAIAALSTAAGPADGDAGADVLRTFTCGGADQPRCPMQAWMKTVMAKAASSASAPQIADALAYVAARVPPGFDAWAEIASTGAAAARAGDIAGAKASCKGCHEKYKQRYKTTMRDRPF